MAWSWPTKRGFLDIETRQSTWSIAIKEGLVSSKYFCSQLQVFFLSDHGIWNNCNEKFLQFIVAQKLQHRVTCWRKLFPSTFNFASRCEVLTWVKKWMVTQGEECLWNWFVLHGCHQLILLFAEFHSLFQRRKLNKRNAGPGLKRCGNCYVKYRIT